MRRSRSKLEKPISSAARKNASAGCAALFFGVFLLFGLGFLYGMVIHPAMKRSESAAWPRVPCVILSSEVGEHRSDDGTTYSIDITFRYEFGGREHTSDQYGFLRFSSSGRASKAQVVAAHPPGFKTFCYVNPNDPREAVLSREAGSELWFALIPGVFAVVGGTGVFFSLRAWSRERRGVSQRSPFGTLPSRETESAPPKFLPKFTGGSEPVTLRPESRPLTRLIGILVFALFWNGIISVFLYQVYKGFREGDPEWFLTIFMIPFVCVGAGMLVAVVFYTIALFNPRPVLTVSSDAVALGDPLDVAWTLEGRSGSIRRLRIDLEGTEEARYRRGTTTTTDRHTFRAIPVVETADALQMIGGAASVTIPADSMHSFEAAENKIIWTLRVRGEIGWWPNVDETFPIVILPRPVIPPAESGVA